MDAILVDFGNANDCFLEARKLKENSTYAYFPNILMICNVAKKIARTSGKNLTNMLKDSMFERWYGVPIVKKGGVIFFKRYHVLPRVYINRANIHTTDAGYHIRLKEGLDKDSVVFCFYNSLTLAQCEFQGRYYGGGVSELVPSEFKALPIPYSKIEREDIEKLDRMFREKNRVEEIVSFVNSKTLMLDMEENTVIDIENIRRKLVKRRL